MKRSVSKKNKLQKSEDGNQQKISAFFQPGTGQPQSKLFSNVAKSKPPLSFKQQASASRPGSSTTAAKSMHKSHSNSGKNSMTVLKDFNSPTSQHGTVQKTESVEVSEPSSPEVLIIPDTPEEKQKSRAKFASRSFLCPASKLATMPGQRLSPPKTKQRRKVKKSLGSVSVEFGKKRENDDETKIQKNSVIVDIATSGFADTKTATGTCVDGSDAASEHAVDVDVLFTSCPRPDRCGTGVGSAERDIDFTDFDMEPGTEDMEFQTLDTESVILPSVGRTPTSENLSSDVKPADPHSILTESHTVKDVCTQPVTPTKVSCDRSSVKRLSVPGLSPDAKRLSGMESVATDSSESSEMMTSQRKVKAKRQLALLAGFKDVRDMNQLVNKYQLGGRARGTSNLMPPVPRMMCWPTSWGR